VDHVYSACIESRLSTSILPYNRLSFALSKSKSFSKTSGLLYTLAPAPAILSIPYTEPFLAFFAFSGMLYLSQHQKSYLKASLCFMLAATFRANGILNVGFLAWHLVWRIADVRTTRVSYECKRD
jgi:Gpi18-like mannosyltransferase